MKTLSTSDDIGNEITGGQGQITTWEAKSCHTSSKMTMGQGRSAPDEGGISRPQLTDEMWIFTCAQHTIILRSVEHSQPVRLPLQHQASTAASENVVSPQHL